MVHPTKLYVSNLNHSATNQELKALFSNYGEVRHVTIVEGRRFAFVEMSNPSEARKAKGALAFSEFKGRILKVKQAYT